MGRAARKFGHTASMISFKAVDLIIIGNGLRPSPGNKRFGRNTSALTHSNGSCVSALVLCLCINFTELRL